LLSALRSQVAGVVGALILAFIVEPLISSISASAADGRRDLA
jgi:hypothetical protein